MENNIIIIEPKWKLVLKKISIILFIIYIVSLVLMLVDSIFFYNLGPNILLSFIRILIGTSVIFFSPLMIIIFSTRLIKTTKRKNFWTILLGIIVGLLLFILGIILWYITKDGLVNFIECMGKNTVCF